jgi:AraC-like DNA-binding protein
LLALDGELRLRTPETRRWGQGSGVLTAPDAAHEIDARGVEVAIVFLDPESDAGAALTGALTGPVRMLTAAERTLLEAGLDPMALIQSGGGTWLRRAVQTLGAGRLAARRRVHPRVRQTLRVLRSDVDGADTSLEGLARRVRLSPGRLMHAFTESVGLPLRPYLAWLRLQRAAAAIVRGSSLADAAYAAGFADAGHMSRTFRHMFGVPPSALRPPK